MSALAPAGRLQAGRSSRGGSCGWFGSGWAMGGSYDAYAGRGERPLRCLGRGRNERADMAHPRIVCRGPEVRLDERRRHAGAALGEDRRRCRVGADLGVAVLDEHRGEAREVAARFGDPHRDLRGALESCAQLLVAVALGQLLAAAQRGERLLVGVRIGLGERGNARAERLGLADHAAGLLPVAVRGACHLRHEPGSHRDDDRGDSASARGRGVAGERVEQLSEGCVKQVAGHAGTIFCLYEEKRSRTASSKAGSCSYPAPSSVLSASANSALRKA